MRYTITGWQGLNSKEVGNVPYFTTSQIDEAVNAGKSADVVVYFIGTISGEGGDRTSLSFDEADLNAISELSKVNPNVIVGNVKSFVAGG